MISIIVAVSKDGFIGDCNNRLPWNLKDDMAFFKQTTIGQTVVMGRKTWESIPEKHRPLKDRLNVVISRTIQQTAEGVIVLKSPEDVTDVQKDFFVIGGGEIYKIFLPIADVLYITQVDIVLGCGVSLSCSNRSTLTLGYR
jgi:dihydrofolate reductase